MEKEKNNLAEESAQRLLAYYSKLRKEMGVSQSELERITGMSRPTINRYENGKLMPTIRAMDRLLAPMGYRLGIVPLDQGDDRKKEEEPELDEKNFIL